jgi:hypothetical protein
MAAAQEVLFIDRFQYLGTRSLHNLVFHDKDAQRAPLSVRLGNVFPFH